MKIIFELLTIFIILFPTGYTQILDNKPDSTEFEKLLVKSPPEVLISTSASKSIGSFTSISPPDVLRLIPRLSPE
jgi:hypothetical protein